LPKMLMMDLLLFKNKKGREDFSPRPLEKKSRGQSLPTASCWIIFLGYQHTTGSPVLK